MYKLLDYRDDLYVVLRHNTNGNIENRLYKMERALLADKFNNEMVLPLATPTTFMEHLIVHGYFKQVPFSKNVKGIVYNAKSLFHLTKEKFYNDREFRQNQIMLPYTTVNDSVLHEVDFVYKGLDYNTHQDNEKDIDDSVNTLRDKLRNLAYGGLAGAMLIAYITKFYPNLLDDILSFFRDEGVNEDTVTGSECIEILDALEEMGKLNRIEYKVGE